MNDKTRAASPVPPLEVLRVSATSRPNAVAGAVAALLRQHVALEILAIGPLAVNQAIKALAIARGYLVEDRLDLHAQPAFVRLDLHAEERTAIKLLIERQPLLSSDGAVG